MEVFGDNGHTVLILEEDEEFLVVLAAVQAIEPRYRRMADEARGRGDFAGSIQCSHVTTMRWALERRLREIEPRIRERIDRKRRLGRSRDQSP